MEKVTQLSHRAVKSNSGENANFRLSKIVNA